MEPFDLPANDTTTALITFDGTPQSYDSDLSSGLDEDWIRVDIVGGSSVVIGVEAYSNFDSILTLYDANGAFLDRNDDAGFGTDYFNSAIGVSPTEDTTYYVSVTDYYVSEISLAGDYTLVVQPDLAGDETTTAQLSVGESLESRWDSFNDYDWVALDVVAGENYQLILSAEPGAYLGGSVRLQTGVATTVLDAYYDTDDDTDTEGYFLNFIALETGTVFAETNSFIDEPGDYALSLGTYSVISGSVMDDTLTGTDASDLIYGFAGHDLLLGGAGGDDIFAGFGDDRVFGGIGDDEVNGGIGDDRLHGEAGDDTLIGSVGEDALWGNSGADVLRGGTGDDSLFGGVGFDELLGGGERDLLQGGAGFDLLNGGAGRDVLEGGPGNDTLMGGDGDDLLTGGMGADVFRYGHGDDTITDFRRGVDEIELSYYRLPSEDPEDLRALSSLNSDGDLVLSFGIGRTLTFEGITNTGAILDDISVL